MAIDPKPANPAIQAEIEKYEAAYRRDPKSRAFATLADAYRRSGRLEHAINIAEQGLKVHPRYLSGVVVLGRAYLQSGRIEDARAQLERVVEISPDNLAAQRTLGEIYFDKGEWERARKAYEEILRVQPNAPEILERIERINQAEKGPVGDETLPQVQMMPGPSTAPAPVSASAPVGMYPAMSEAEKMDIFFGEVDVSSPSEESRSTDYEVKSIGEIFTQAHSEAARQGAEPPGPAQGQGAAVDRAKSPITTETMANLYLKQGYKDKALMVYEEIYQTDPARGDIKMSIMKLREELAAGGKIETEPEKAPSKEPPGMEELRAREVEQPKREIRQGLTPQIARPTRALNEWWEREPGPGDEGREMTGEESTMRNLRSYLEIIRRGGKK